MKVTDRKAIDLFLARKVGTAAENKKVTEHNGVFTLELFGNAIAWHHPDGEINVRVTVASYTTHTLLNALAFTLGAPFCAFTESKVPKVRSHGTLFTEADGSTQMHFILRPAR